MQVKIPKVVVAVGVVILVVLMVFVANYFHTARKAAELPNKITSKVLNADEAIRTYEWFKEQQAFINTCLKNEIVAQEEYDAYTEKLPKDMKDWSEFMSKEESALRASTSALKKLTNKAIEDYNAKASMVHKEIFKDLPTNILRSIDDANKLVFGAQ